MKSFLKGGIVLLAILFCRAGFSAKICGYEIADHAPNAAVIARLAGAAYVSQDNQGAVEFHFPLFTSLAIASKNKGFVGRALDGVMRTGAARTKNLEIRPLDSEVSFDGDVKDIAVAGVLSPTVHKIKGDNPDFGAGLQVDTEIEPSNFDQVLPVFASLDKEGDVTVHIPSESHVCLDLQRESRKFGHIRGAHSHFAITINSPRDHKIRSISMNSPSKNWLRIFALTDQGILSADIHFETENFAERANNLEFTMQHRMGGGQFVRSVGTGRRLLVGSEGSHQGHAKISEVNLGKRSERQIAEIPGWLVSLSGYENPSTGHIQIASLAYTFEEGATAATPTMSLGDETRLEPLAMSFEDAPVALLYAGIPEFQDPWADRIGGQVFQDGLLVSKRKETGELIRLLVLTRNGDNYTIRSVKDNQGQITLSSEPWTFIGSQMDMVRAELTRAGFDLAALDAAVHVETEIGGMGEFIGQKLRQSPAFGRFLPGNPSQYLAAELVTTAWRRRLHALRDIRLQRSQVKAILNHFDITEHWDQLLVYELMLMEEEERNRILNLEASPIAFLTDEQWETVFIHHLSVNDVLSQPVSEIFPTLKSYYQGRMHSRTWEDVKSTFSSMDLIEMDAAKYLFLISERYLGKPFKYTVRDFLTFCETHGWNKTRAAGEPRLLREALNAYLESVDPLRADHVINTPSLIQFLQK